MKTKVTAVFDIGKTNKKFFLLDENYKEVYREYTSFEEIQDEDGYPTENIEALKIWVKEVFYRVLENELFNIKAINFSTYGASFVHLDQYGQVLTPLYNYTKEIDSSIEDNFYNTYGPELELARTSGSPKSGLLNSGMQLYWIKHTKPEIFQKIKYSLHLPQYLSYISQEFLLVNTQALVVTLLYGIMKPKIIKIGCIKKKFLKFYLPSFLLKPAST